MTAGSAAEGNRQGGTNRRTKSPESTPEMASDDAPQWEKRLSIDTFPKTDDDQAPMLAGQASKEVRRNKALRFAGSNDDWISPSSSSSSSSSGTPSGTGSSPRPLQRTNDRLTSIARTAVRATKEQFWDSNETGIVAAQTAVDRWEDAYVWVRNAVVASSRSVAGIYDASKAGARGLDKGLLVPVRDYLLLPTFGFAEHVVSETSSFLRSEQAERIKTAASRGSAEFVSRTVPFGLGDTVVLPAVKLGAETMKTAWDVARYPVPSPKRVRDTVDFWLNGSKHNLSVCGREIRWYVRRADANIGRTLRRTQWVVLGRGPYETLDDAGRRDVMDHVCDRYLSLGNVGGNGDNDSDGDESDSHSRSHHHRDGTIPLMVARYEFMANVRACNRSLYRDLVETGLLKERGGKSTRDDEWLSERPLYRTHNTDDVFLLREDEGKDQDQDEALPGDGSGASSAFALWFRLPSENGQKPKRDVPWIAFGEAEAKKLEDKYRSILKDTNEDANAAAARGGDSVDRTTGANDKSNANANANEEQRDPSRDPALQQRARAQGHAQRQEPAWESPKYETNSKWYDPDLDRDVLVDQKRYAIRFVRCCPVCRKPHPRDDGEGISRPLHETCGDCRPADGEAEQSLEGESAAGSAAVAIAAAGAGADASPSWRAERLLALPPPLLGLHRPTMWRSYGPDEIRRAVWFLDTPQHGPQPYGEDAQAMLEDAYHFLKWTIESKRIKGLSDCEDGSNGGEIGDDKRDANVLLTVQVPSPDNGEQQLVQFSSLTVATAIGRGLGGAIALFKRRVYRGAYHCFQKDDAEPTKADSAIGKQQAQDVSLPVDEESIWTATTDEALERLRLTIASAETLADEALERLDIDIDYEECFKDVDVVQETEENKESPLQEDESPTLTISKQTTRDDPPSLAFPIEMPRGDVLESDAESSEADHLILVIHGIGEMMKTFDLFGLKKVPTIADCCGYLRDNHTEISGARLAQTFQTNNTTLESKTSERVEYLPVEWHEAFSIQSTRRPSTSPVSSHANRSKSTVGINDISLRTIPNLRSFANDTLMDILYFMSPTHHDIIIDIVTFELNFIVKRFRTLTGFKGEISIIGHSLGSIVAWDILDHQETDDIDPQTESTLTKDDKSYRYPQLKFQTDMVFLLGSPIPVFLMMRNQENPLPSTFALNGCPKVFNIFHPYDPVSYRIEPLLHPRNAEIEPYIMTHWNGGFRFQYQTKRLWKKIVDQTLRAEENMIHSLESGIKALGLVDSSFTKNSQLQEDDDSSHILLTGSLNGGRRIDYMLQEKEIESANEYVAALAAHSSYWLEKDLSLFIANEICLEKERKQISNIKP